MNVVVMDFTVMNQTPRRCLEPLLVLGFVSLSGKDATAKRTRTYSQRLTKFSTSNDSSPVKLVASKPSALHCMVIQGRREYVPVGFTVASMPHRPWLPTQYKPDSPIKNSSLSTVKEAA